MVRSWWGQNGGRRDGDRRIGWGGGGGGGGGGQPPPPMPPPYTPYPKPPPPTTSPNPPTTGAGQGFGFWTGLGLGGLGAYLATRRRDPRLEESYHARDAAWGGFGRHDGYERRGGRVEREFDRTAGAGRVDVAESSRMGEMRMRRGTAFGGTDVR
jgi:MYXO-CTERM domain-containing protein